MKKQKFMKREIDESMLIDFLAGRLSSSEQAMVEEWYDESEQHKKILEDIYYISVLCNCAEVVKNIDVEYSLRQLRKRVAENERRAKSRFPVLLRRIATYGAAAMVIVALSFVVLKQASDRVRFEEVYAENSVVSVSLPDGSTACLQPDSRITYPVNAGGGKKYEVDIEGEARFDVVLVDAPCSGFGIIRKKPDVRYKKPDDLFALPVIQRAILDNAARYVRPGGTLVYSTCTILPEENEGVSDSFLAEHPDFCRTPFSLSGPVGETEGQVTLWPHRHGTDGFYICRMTRN